MRLVPRNNISRFAYVLIGFLCFATTTIAQKPSVHDTPETAKSDPDFAVQGEYVATTMGLQVIASGDGDFNLVLFPGGLPGAGWNGAPPQRTDGDADTVLEIVKSKGLKRIERQSPSLGAKPPFGALVLFDGTQDSLAKHWNSSAKRTEDGLLIQGVTSKDTFRDYTLHIEFRTPFQPKASGQGRGNSGVYHQGRYETQILDSFGLEGKNNETGGIYSVRDPDINLCFPPLTWQTYDIEFTAARFDTAGTKTSDAILTVRLNGVVVQRDVPVPGPTAAAPFAENNSDGPIHLQDHGNPVRFRNIWVLPRDADRESLRPIVSGAERFSEDASLSGKILISELGCAACHATDDAELTRKSAPILDRVASRLRPDHMLTWIGAPHQAKPGTTMPDLFHGQSIEERTKSIQAIASFLSTTGKRIDRSGDSAAALRGEALFHTIGCVACHSPRLGLNTSVGTSVPLGDLTNKYTLDGLRAFLLDPLSIRPSGAMPKLTKNRDEANDLACYLLGEKIIVPGVEQFSATVYHGKFDKLPDFDKLKAVKTGTTIGLDLSIAGRKDNFAMQFDSYFPVTTAGDHTFFLGSDDGSRLLIDDKQVVISDGIHPKSEVKGTVRLETGIHKLRIEYFEASGGEELSLEVEGPDIVRTSIGNIVTSDPSGNVRDELIEAKFKPDLAQVANGQAIFESKGCANCHQLELESKKAVEKIASKPLKQLRPAQGCLAEKVLSGLPDYALTRIQRSAIETALAEQSKPMADRQMADRQLVHLQMAAKNCYACHSRDSVVGPEPARDALFTTTMKEMGNEGRVPPTLTGVGDKLRPEVIDKIIAEGAKDRPYMVTRMPGFGAKNLQVLRSKLVAIDERNSAKPSHIPNIESPEGKELLVAGRKLTGSTGLSCIKCHRFGSKGTPGIQAIDMLTMTERLREDWFHRYMLAPTEYRPGTRMPLSFPEGKSALETVFDGNADRQIDALWLYLSQGRNASKPTGLDSEAIVLAADSKPVIYRNFIEGLSPRGIAVGYPEHVNLAWDAGTMSLAILWQNEFIDAGKHWTGRGEGVQSPLGDKVIRFEKAAPIAKLASPTDAWPTEKARERGYRFRGYSLNASGQPTFKYGFSDVEIEDTPRPIAKTTNVSDSGFDRELKIKVNKPTDSLLVLLGSGQIQSETDGSFTLNKQVKIRVAGVKAELVAVGDHQELRASLPREGEIVITQSIFW
jgi:mono/diheme cytochrome c family protein